MVVRVLVLSLRWLCSGLFKDVVCFRLWVLVVVSCGLVLCRWWVRVSSVVFLVVVEVVVIWVVVVWVVWLRLFM